MPYGFNDDKSKYQLVDATTSAAGLMSATDKTKLNGIATGANNYTHPAYTALTGKPTANATPAFGSTATVSQVTTDATGHVTSLTDRTIKIPNTAATTSAAGLMSAADKTKLDGIATQANKYVHPAYTAYTGKPAANQTPAFGGTATVSQIVSDSTGHVTSMTDRTIKIPNATATTSAAGLMSAADKTKLDKIGGGYDTSSTGADYTETGNGVGAAKTCADSTTVDLGALNLTAGTWLIVGVVRWTNTNTNGQRSAYISTSSSPSASAGVFVDISDGGAYYTNNRVVRVVKHSSTTAYHLCAYQSSGASLTAQGWMSCIKLG